MLHAKEKRITRTRALRSKSNPPASCVSERCKFTWFCIFQALGQVCVSAALRSHEIKAKYVKSGEVMCTICVSEVALPWLTKISRSSPRWALRLPSQTIRLSTFEKVVDNERPHRVVSVPLLPSSDALKARAMYHKKPKRMMCLDGSASAKLEC